jgi:hypothetical protein
VRRVGQLSDPYKDAEDEGLGITISGLPGEPEEPPVDDDIDVESRDLDTDDGDDESTDDDVDAPVSDAADDSDEDDDSDDLEDDDDVEEVEDDGDEEGDEETTGEVAYDLSEWDDDQLTALGEALDEAGVAHAWDEDELYVREVDEQLVDVILEEVSHPHALEPESDDGDAGAVLLGELFVVADRLQHDPEENEAVALLLRLANAAEDADPPYGLGDDDWETLRGRVDTLAEALEVDDPNLDEVLEAASQLRNAIRPFV